MSWVNMGSILEKVQDYVYSEGAQNEIRDIVHSEVMLGDSKSEIHTPEEAADKFIEVLHKEMESSGLSSDAISAIEGLNYTSPVRIGDSNEYTIEVYFDEDMSRPSLQSDKYGGIDDLAELFNNGVDHTMRPVHGVWHDKEIWSRTVIPGTHFMEQAIADFMGNYASEYNVTNIKLLT